MRVNLIAAIWHNLTIKRHPIPCMLKKRKPSNMVRVVAVTNARAQVAGTNVYQLFRNGLTYSVTQENAQMLWDQGIAVPEPKHCDIMA